MSGALAVAAGAEPHLRVLAADALRVAPLQGLNAWVAGPAEPDEQTLLQTLIGKLKVAAPKHL